MNKKELSEFMSRLMQQRWTPAKRRKHSERLKRYWAERGGRGGPKQPRKADDLDRQHRARFA